jgi:hypothetical protein
VADRVRGIAAGQRLASGNGSWTGLQTEADATVPDGALAEAVVEEIRQREREWVVNIDSGSCRAHQHAAGACHRPPRDFPQGKGAVRVWKPMDRRCWGARGAG